MRAMPPLETIRAFHETARALSFKDAARALGLTPSAISHRIRALEEALGAPLFRRHTRAIELTEEGARYWTHVKAAFAELEKAGEAVRQTGHRTLRVSALPFFTSTCIIPHLGLFRKQHPGIALAIETSNDLRDLESAAIDIAIRNLTAPPAQHDAVKLLDVRPVLLCAPSLLETGPPLGKPEDLARHTLIHCTPRPDVWPDWLAQTGLKDLEPAHNLWVDTVPAMLEAAAEGQGVTLGMDPLIRLAPIRKRLTEPFRTAAASSAAYYLLHRKEDGARPDIRAFKSWIKARMGEVKRTRAP